MHDINILLFLTHSLFTLGLASFVSYRDNIFIMFILSEIMLISGAVNFIVYGYYFQHSGGQVIALIVISLGAASAAIGLALIINFVKLQSSFSLVKSKIYFNKT